MAEIFVALLFGFCGFFTHFQAVISVKAVTFNNGCRHFFSAENILKSARDRSSAGA